MAKSFEALRPKPYIVFVAAIWNRCRMYMVCGQERNKEQYFHTKQEAAKYIRNNFAGDEKRIRLHDLKQC